MQGRDYAVAIRTAHMMQKLGLVDVDVRMNDKVAFVTTQSANYEEMESDFTTYNDWTSGISEGQTLLLRELKEETGITEKILKNIEMCYVTLRKTNGEIRQKFIELLIL